MTALSSSARTPSSPYASPIPSEASASPGALRGAVDLMDSLPMRLARGVQCGAAGALAVPAAGALAVGTGVTTALVMGPCMTAMFLAEANERHPDYVGTLVMSGFWGGFSAGCVALGTTALVAWSVTALAGAALGASYGFLRSPEQD